MPDHELVALAGELVGHRNRLARVARVIADVELELLAEHAARLVDVGHRLLGAVLAIAHRTRRIAPSSALPRQS